jgi:hypothetical protein
VPQYQSKRAARWVAKGLISNILGAPGLDSGVHRQQVGLLGDRLDRCDDVADLRGLLL